TILPLPPIAPPGGRLHDLGRQRKAGAFMAGKGVTIGHEALRGLTRDLIAAGGSEAAEAAIVADHLVEANLRGHDSHGVGMIPHYVRNLKFGKLRPNTHARFEREE